MCIDEESDEEILCSRIMCCSDVYKNGLCEYHWQKELKHPNRCHMDECENNGVLTICPTHLAINTKIIKDLCREIQALKDERDLSNVKLNL
jgi:hypothetical protein